MSYEGAIGSIKETIKAFEECDFKTLVELGDKGVFLREDNIRQIVKDFSLSQKSLFYHFLSSFHDAKRINVGFCSNASVWGDIYNFDKVLSIINLNVNSKYFSYPDNEIIMVRYINLLRKKKELKEIRNKEININEQLTEKRTEISALNSKLKFSEEIEKQYIEESNKLKSKIDCLVEKITISEKEKNFFQIAVLKAEKKLLKQQKKIYMRSKISYR